MKKKLTIELEEGDQFIFEKQEILETPVMSRILGYYCSPAQPNSIGKMPAEEFFTALYNEGHEDFPSYALVDRVARYCGDDFERFKNGRITKIITAGENGKSLIIGNNEISLSDLLSEAKKEQEYGIPSSCSTSTL